MVNVGGIARLGTLAVGLGIGAAWAHTPIASADTSGDAASTVDSLLSGASPAPAAAINLDISFDGYTLYDGGGSAVANTGAAGNGLYDFAIAYGDGAYASAEGGTADYALASGTDANAEAGSLASGATGNNFDSAVDIGNNGSGYLTGNAGAYAGNGSLQFGGTDIGTDSNDSAYDFGNNSAGQADSGAFAGYYSGTSGNGDTAYDVGNNSGGGSYDGALAVAGNGNYASDSGNNTATTDYSFAGEGNNNTAIADTSYTTAGKFVGSYDGNGNYAYVDGPDNSTATATGGSDIAYVSDPFSSATGPADSAVAGDGFTNDLAEVLLAHGNTTADTANLLYDIASLFGNFSGSF
jgi:hypothetical protein